MGTAGRFVVAAGVAFVLAVSPGAVGPRDASPAAPGLTRVQADEMVRAHNAWRRRFGSLALRWVPDLAAMAQRRAEYLASHGCYIEHGLLPEDVGENLYRIGPAIAEGRDPELATVTGTQVVDEWGGESADYNVRQDTCKPGRQCGHYTQLVWASTEEVGCGMSVCSSRGQVWVCNYRPRGNIRIVR